MQPDEPLEEVRLYYARHEVDARGQFAADAAKLAEIGFEPIGDYWDPRAHSKWVRVLAAVLFVAFILVPLTWIVAILWIRFPPNGVLTVVYRLREEDTLL